MLASCQVGNIAHCCLWGETACNIFAVITITRDLFNNNFQENHYHENNYHENHYHDNHYHEIHYHDINDHFVAVIDDITRCKDTDLGGFPVWSILLGFDSLKSSAVVFGKGCKRKSVFLISMTINLCHHHDHQCHHHDYHYQVLLAHIPCHQLVHQPLDLLPCRGEIPHDLLSGVSDSKSKLGFCTSADS